LQKLKLGKKWPPEQVQAIIEAIYLAQREALKVPEGDRLIRFIEYLPEHFHVPPGKTANFTLVEITIFSGRSIEAKRELYKAIVKKFGNSVCCHHGSSSNGR